MLVLKLFGGLGNQMFQYAYARWLQSKYQEDIFLDVTGFANYPDRAYSLHNLNLPTSISIMVESDIEKIYDLSYKLRYRLLGRGFHGLRSFKRLSRLGLYVSEDVCYYPFVQSNFKKKYIIGLFQSEKYFKEIKDALKEELYVSTSPSKRNVELIKELGACNSVCVHIRRGDYAASSRHQVCHESYYREGMDIISSKVNNPVFYVFSDDITWIKANYHFKYPVRYVEQNNPDYEELRLMYSCRHFVISNSSFSWWGSYLCRNEDKLVVAPSRWFSSDLKTDIHLDAWTLIQV